MANYKRRILSPAETKQIDTALIEKTAEDFGCSEQCAFMMLYDPTRLLTAVICIGSSRIKHLDDPAPSPSRKEDYLFTCWELDGKRATIQELIVAADEICSLNKKVV